MRMAGWGQTGHLKLRAQPAKNSPFLPVLSLMGFCKGPLALLLFPFWLQISLLSFPMVAFSPSASLMSLTVLSYVSLGCSVLFLGLHCCLCANSSFCFSVFSLLLLSFQSFLWEEMWNEVTVSFSAPQACLLVASAIILTSQSPCYSNWLLIIQVIYKSLQAFCWCCAEVYLLFSIASVKNLYRDADYHSPCLLAFWLSSPCCAAHPVPHAAA